MQSDLATKTRDASTAAWSWWWEVKTKEDELARAALTISTVMITISWYFWIMKKSKQARLSLPPGPQGLPLVGNLPFIDPELHSYFAKLTNTYGPIFKLKLGTKLCVVIGSPDLAKEVLKDYDATFANRDTPVSGKVISYGLSGMVFSPYGPHWRMIRLLCVREILSKTSLDSLYSIRRVEVLRTVNDIYTKIGTPINIGEQIFPVMLNVLMRMLWSGTLEEDEGKSTGTTGSNFRLVIEEIIELLGKVNISDLFPVLARFDIQGIERRMKQLLLWIDQFFDSIIDQRMKFDQENENKDVLKVLLQLKDQADSKTPFSITNLKALFLELVTGGTDTSLTTVEWAMAELINNSETMRKAQEELEVVVGRNNMVDESHLPKLNYLDAVVKETLRLHPGVPLLVSRCPSLSCTVGGYTIPKGTQVFVNAWGIHKDPKNWDNPNEFQPERFLNCAGSSNKWDNNGNNFRFIPFGSGRRKCVGVPLVERTVPYVLACLLHSFEWRVPEGTEVDLTEKFGIVLKKATPLIAIPSPRLSDSKLYF